MRAFDGNFLVNGKPLLIPDAGVELSFSDLDAASAGRDESGFLHRIRLRKGVRTWAFTYSVLTREELDYLMELFSDASFPFTDGESTVTAYCSKQEVRLWDRRNGVYKGLKFTVIEC